MRKLIIVILLLLVASQLLLPAYFSHQLETGLKREFKSSRELEAEINSFPALLMLTGDFQSVSLQGENLILNELKVAKLKAEFSDVKLKPTGKEKEKWKLVKGKNKKLNLTLKEADLEAYLADQLKPIKGLTLNLGPKQTVLIGDFPLLGNEVEVRLGGRFQLKNKHKLIFLPQDLMVEDWMIQRKIVQRLLKKIDFSLDLQQLPIPLQADKVKVEKDKLIILGGVKE